MFQKIEKLLYRIVEKLENQKIGLTGWLAGFFSVVFLRIFLEIFSTQRNDLLSTEWDFFSLIPQFFT